jgi:pantoate--beta-alanine ligase
VRSPDGLALSSRNAYLTPQQRRIAPRMHHVITRVATAVSEGGDMAKASATAVSDLRQAGFDPIDYVEVRDGETLSPAGPGTQRPLRVLAAAWLGKTRLIDNVAIFGGNPD